MENWKKDLGRMVHRKRKVLVKNTQNVVNRRIEDTLGGEEEKLGFRFINMYFQLSPDIDIEKTIEVIKLIYKKIGGFYTEKKFNLLFLNNSEYKLIYPQGVVYRLDNAIQIVKEYYKKYTTENTSFSRQFKELFPKHNSRLKIPNKEDLNIIFHDGKGLEIDSEIIKRTKNIRKKYIWICVQKGQPLIFNDKQPEFINKAINIDSTDNK